jgi:hypothetical protein
MHFTPFRVVMELVFETQRLNVALRMEEYYMLRSGVLASTMALFSIFCIAQPKTSVYKVTSPIQSLNTQLGATINNSTPPYSSGTINPDNKQVIALLQSLGADTKTTTIIHLLRWNDKDHTTVMFQKWYLYDPTPSKSSFYLESKAQMFQQSAIPGRTHFQFVYIHLNFDFTKGQDEWMAEPTPKEPTPTLKHPINYTITVAKAQTQFIQDLQTLLQILKVVNPLTAAAATTSPGYFSVTTFDSCSDVTCTNPWPTSTITIAAQLDSSSKTETTTTVKDKSTKATSASGQLTSNTYHNERPTWIGLSAGVPITSYKDVTFQQSSGTLVPKTTTQQNVYIFLDGYLPPVLPTLTNFRYIPHPFFGLPLKGEVFRHTMLGGGIGFHWLEPFGGVIFDTQNKQVTGPNLNKTHVTYQAVFGLKMSMSALATALKSK